MKKRTIKLLEYLQKNNQLKLEKLQDEFSISIRTLRNDIHEIDDFLRENNLGEAELVKGELKYFISDKELLEKKLNEFNVYNYRLSKKERILIAITMLIKSDDYISIQSICEKLLVSRTTFLGDLKELRGYVTKYNLELYSKTNKGLKILGEEKNIRFFLIDYLEEMKLNEEISFLESPEVFNIDLSQLTSFIKKYFDKNITNKFIKYLKIAIWRNNIGKFLYSTECIDLELLNKLRTVFERDEYAELSFTDNDLISFINNFSAKSQENSIRNFTKLQIITMEFIEKISKDMNIDLTGDYIFYNNLSNHIAGMDKNTISDSSEEYFLEELINRNKRVNKVVWKYINLIEKAINRKVNDNEKSYILIHIYAALERKKKKSIAIKAALLTDYRKGTVLFLESQLKNNFSFELTTFSDIDEVSLDNFDLYLTTMDGVDKFFKISSVVNDEEFITISKEIDRIIKEKEKSDFSIERDLAYKIYDLVATEVDKNDTVNKKVLKENIKKSIMNHSKTNNNSKQLSLSNFLTEDKIKMNITVKDWKEAVIKAGEILVLSNDIKEEYINEVCKNLEENDFYIVISKEFAFPHAAVSKNVNETAMSFIKLTDSVYFKTEDEALEDDDIRKYPVKYVCMLSPSDNKKHLRAFFNLTNLLKKDEFKKELDNAASAEEIHNIIEDFEYLLELERGFEDV